MDAESVAAAPEAPRISDRTLRRLAWVAVIAVAVGFAIQVVFAFLNRHVQAGENAGWSATGVVGFVAFLPLLGFPIVGFILAIKIPRNWIGWIMLGIGLSMAMPLDALAHYVLLTRHGEIPGGTMMEAIANPFWVPLIGLAGIFLVLLFPDGHLPSPRWKWFARLSGATLVLSMLLVLVEPGPFDTLPGYSNPLGLTWIDPFLLVILFIPIAIVGAAVSLVQRYRRSSGVERLQLKWLAAAVAVMATTYLIVEPLSALVSGSPWLSTLQSFALFTFGLIPVAIGFAVLAVSPLRHRRGDQPRGARRRDGRVHHGGLHRRRGRSGSGGRQRGFGVAFRDRRGDRCARLPAGPSPRAAIRGPARLRRARDPVRGVVGVLGATVGCVCDRRSAAPNGAHSR